MAEAIDIRELNIRIEQQSHFVTNLVTGMNKVIVGQKHLVDCLLIGLLSDSVSAHQLVNACTTRVVRAHISCYASAQQLLCGLRS